MSAFPISWSSQQLHRKSLLYVMMSSVYFALSSSVQPSVQTGGAGVTWWHNLSLHGCVPESLIQHSWVLKHELVHFTRCLSTNRPVIFLQTVGMRHCSYHCLSFILCHLFQSPGAHGGVVGWGTALQTGRSRVRLPMVSLEFSIDIILPAAFWPWGWLSL
jgi:hypothetical protein